MPSLRDAGKRHAAHYLEVATSADELYRSGNDALKNGLALFDSEWDNINAGLTWAMELSGQDESAAKICSAYVLNGCKCMSFRLRPTDLLKIGEAALAAARHRKNPYEEAMHLSNAGETYLSLNEPERAIQCFQESLRAVRRCSDAERRRPEGNALCYLGKAYLNSGQIVEALECWSGWLSIARELGDRMDEATALGNIGVAYAYSGDYAHAAAYYELRLAIVRDTGDLRGEADTLSNLAMIHMQDGDSKRGLDYLNRTLAISRDIGDKGGEIDALQNLATGYAHAGELVRAEQLYRESCRVARESGDARRCAGALVNLSVLLDGRGDRQGAITVAEEALEIFEQTRDPLATVVRERLADWR